MVNYSPGKSKESIRNLVLSFFLQNECKKVITLPNIYFDLENKLSDSGISVDCIERDKAIFIKQKTITKRSFINIYNCTLGNINVEQYDGLFLDLCGTFTKELNNTLIKLKKGSNVVITLLAARESNNLKKEIDIKKREESYIRLFRRYNIVIEKYINYNDTSPMLVFFGKNINKDE